MTNKNEITYDKEIDNKLKIDCEKCVGLCCVALFFSKTDGFPIDKEAGKPCINLEPNFKCKVHKNLSEKGLKGCIAYDCFGAGQKVAQVTYSEEDWRKNPQSAKKIFDGFLVMKQLHEMLWYLTEAFRLQSNDSLKEEISKMIMDTDKLTDLTGDSLMELDLVAHRFKVNALLLKTSEALRAKASRSNKNSLKNKKTIGGRLNLIGLDLKKVNLVGENLSGALLIAADLRDVDLSFADLIGADMRDTDLRGANLSNSIYITQAQINAAKGNANTKLPKSIVRPSHWEKG